MRVFAFAQLEQCAARARAAPKQCERGAAPCRIRCPALSGVIFFLTLRSLSNSSSPWKPPFTRCFLSFVMSLICSFLLLILSFCFSACTCLEYCLFSRFFRLHAPDADVSEAAW
jgi:hypothetical protein